MEDFTSHLAERVRQWKAQGLERTPWEFISAQHPQARINGRELLLFSSSNYLGLSTHPRVLKASAEALGHYGAGSGGSRLTSGTTAAHHQLERDLADWLGYESAVYFATGYQANVGALTAVADAHTTIFSDEKNHASIIDGARLSRAQVTVYPHRDVETLERMLSQCETPFALVVTDGLFSMDGVTSPVGRLAEVAHRHGAWLMVDEAHSLGSLGATGRGCVEDEGLLDAPSHQRPDLLIGTASKAFGSEGGFVCCSATVEQLLRNQSRPYVYSTSNAAPVIAATAMAVRVLQDEPELLRNLRANVAYLVESLEAEGLTIPDRHPDSPIIPIWIGDETRALTLSQRLREAGIHVPAIRYPTVPRGRAMLRVTVMASHTRQQCDQLVAALMDAGAAEPA